MQTPQSNQPLTIHNTGKQDLILFKFFGPDINPDLPMLRAHSSANYFQS